MTTEEFTFTSEPKPSTPMRPRRKTLPDGVTASMTAAPPPDKPHEHALEHLTMDQLRERFHLPGGIKTKDEALQHIIDPPPPDEPTASTGLDDDHVALMPPEHDPLAKYARKPVKLAKKRPFSVPAPTEEDDG